MDPLVVFGAIASGIAAVGVVIQLVIAGVTRSRVEIDMTTARPVILLDDRVHMTIRNVGNSAAHGLVVQGLDCKVGPPPAALSAGTLGSGESDLITVDSVTQDSWVTVAWIHPFRQRLEMTWFPVLPNTDLVKSHREQRDRGFLARIRAAVGGPQVASPATRLRVSMSSNARAQARLVKRINKKSARDEKRQRRGGLA